MNRATPRTAVISGGGTGIGRAVAEALLQDGYHLALLGRRDDVLAESARNNARGELEFNSDGSVDILFGPEQPAELQNHWIQTVPGKGWFTILRVYGPLEPWYDHTWRPGDIQPISD